MECTGKVQNIAKLQNTNAKKHGMSNTRLYHIWMGMKQRCLNSNAKNYKRYGGKGISICDEWCDFENFRKWALENGYEDGLTIDRKNTDKNYEPDNCRWATWKTQQNNRSNNKLIEYCGQIKTVAEWAEIMNMPRYIIYQRLKKGWCIEKALTTTVRKRGKSLEGNGNFERYST